MQIIHDLQDMTYLQWTQIRRSSGTAGSFLKAREQIGHRQYYYKLSNYDAIYGVYGHECVNEIIVDRLLTLLQIPHLHYDLIHARIEVRGQKYTTYLCRSEDFKKKGDLKTALDAYYDMESQTGETPLQFCRRLGFSEYIDQMLLIDFLILNRDRHGANIEILKNSFTHEVRLAPLFDHGLSLVFSCYDDASLQEVNPREDKAVQCFVGGHSAWENLQLITRKNRIALPEFDDKMRVYLFDGVGDVVSAKWKDTVWRFLQERAEMYEDFCNQEC